MDGLEVLSTRGRRLIENRPMPAYADAHTERIADRYHPEQNPDGYLGLCVAENKLVWDLLAPRFRAPRDLPAASLDYDDMIGNQEFRGRLSRFMGRTFLGRTFDPSQIAVVAGAGSVLELLFGVIADTGDGVLVPTPSYPGFWMDLETRDELTIVPVHTRSEDGFRLTAELLDAALERAERPVKALLYTNPSNPLGTVASADEIEMVVVWTRRHDLHLVVDEVYALSVFGDVEFVSAASLLPSLGDRVHVVWAFSKDLGVSGLRCGVLVSENEAVIAGVDGLAYWAAVSGDTQFVLGELVDDAEWVDGYLDAMRVRLRESQQTATAALERNRIPHLAGPAGFFLLVDLRGHLDEPTWEAEDRLWGRLLTEANVNLTPGSECRIGEPGFMRLVFTTEPPAHVAVAIDRVGAVLNG